MRGQPGRARPVGCERPGAICGHVRRGPITVYAALTDAAGKALATAFEHQGHGQLNVVTGGMGALVTRLESERKAGGARADALLLADPTAMNALEQEGALADYTPAEAARLKPSLRGGTWAAAFTFNNVILSHKGSPLPAPTDWKDLGNPAYQGKIELADPAYSGTTLGMVGVLAQREGWSYFEGLRKLEARVVQSTNTVGTDVAAGRAAVGISLDTVGRDLEGKGSPVQIVWPASGAIPVPAPVALVKGHNSPAARAFSTWLLSAQGQETVAQLGYPPALGSSALVPASATRLEVDWAKLHAQRDEVLSRFKGICG